MKSLLFLANRMSLSPAMEVGLYRGGSPTAVQALQLRCVGAIP